MKQDELEQLLKIGMPIAAICSVWGMGLFIWVFIRDWLKGEDIQWIGLVLIEIFLLSCLIYFIWFMRNRWGWFRKK